MKPIFVSSGEPAGIGPDLCLALAGNPLPLVILADPLVLEARAALLGKTLNIEPYQYGHAPKQGPDTLTVYPVTCPQPVVPGLLSPDSAAYVMALLTLGAKHCLSKEASALVTAPVNKAIINQGGIPFVGHTEFFAEYSDTETVVMMLVSPAMNVSLVTTHLPLHAVAQAITSELLTSHISLVHQTLQQSFAIKNPKIKVAGLNPHAGEGGYLGQEEITVITPVIKACQAKGMDVQGPLSADTMYLQTNDCDAFVAMYHDQGLPVLKYASFGAGVNVSCGLPFIRTSVDHGTAIELAGTGRANPDSLLAAVDLAATMVTNRASYGY